MTLDPGTRLGTYEILGPLGAGGMGEVYRAHDRKLGREVAIKVLSEAFASDPSRVARFEREARMLAAVNHPGIAAIYGAEEDGDFRYIVMELVQGETLSEKLAAGPIPIPEALSLAAQIAEALSVAHEKNVIHRDLKPANIKVTPEGRIKVLDLGLAKAMEMETPAGDISKSPTVIIDDSRPGNLLGTPGFMSPEQARGRETDRRADIWAFGCVLFEMLSGKRAFAGESVPDILLAILDREPDWEALPAATPSRIQDLLHRCLEKDPNRRLRDAGDARLEIETALASSGTGRGRAARWGVAAAALAGAAAVAIGMLALKSSTGSANPLPDRKFVAVFSVGDVAAEPTVQHIGDGFAETVRTRLMNAPTLQVVPTRTAVSASGRDLDLPRIARQLGVNIVVRISFWIEKEQVRVTYVIIQMDLGQRVQSGVLNGSLSDVFGLADRLAANVARDLELPPLELRTATPPGLKTDDERSRYLQAIGFLRRYDRRDSVEQALPLLTALAAQRPDSPLVQAALGRACLAMFDFTKERTWADKAFVAAEAAKKLDPGVAEVDITLGDSLLKTGRAREAVEAFQRALSTQPASYEARLGLGRALDATREDGPSETAFRSAIELQPASFAGYNQLGALLYRRGRYADAADMFRKAARLEPDSYRALSNLGGARTMTCDFSGATDAYRKALALSPTHPSALSNLGLNLLWTGHPAEAVELLEKAANVSPNQFDVRGNLGDAYRAIRGQEAKATEAYTRSVALAREQLRLNPRDFRAQSFVASGLARTGHPDEADKEIRRALDLAPNEPEILADAAVVAVLAGRDSEALDLVKKAVAAGYCGAIIARQPEFEKFHANEGFQQLTRGPRSFGS
jgi:serine/threonine protein kinase/Flp pilus assembly protein TadD